MRAIVMPSHRSSRTTSDSTQDRRKVRPPEGCTTPTTFSIDERSLLEHRLVGATLELCLVGATVEPADEFIEVHKPVVVIVHIVE